MKTISTLLITLLASMTLFVGDADAKRFGGGKSFGKSYSNMSTKKAPSSQATPGSAAKGSTAGQAGAKSGASRWLGPLAGLAAGGLLAAMLFGDGFEGLQIFDMLLFAGLIFGGFMLFKIMRARSTQRPQAAGGVPFGGDPSSQQQPHGNMDFQGVQPAMGGGDGVGEAPVWFNGDEFAEGSKTHFIRLQAAWDKGDFRDIRDYTTPEMYAELQQEHKRSGSENNFTEVVMLNTELLGTRREGDQLVVSMQFTGLIREEEGAQATDLSEIWHVVHDWDSEDGDWLIAGIQQVDG